MKKFILILVIISFSIVSAQVKTIVQVNATLLGASLDSAVAQVGITEQTGHNDGRKIEQYLASVGRIRGDAYCAAGQYWCFYVAAIALNLQTNNIPIKRTGMANEMMNAALKEGKRVSFFPMRNDLIVWRRGKTFSGHIERIFRVDKGGWVGTIGFNTSSSNSRNTKVEGVFIKRRNIFHSLSRMAVRGIIGFRILVI